jgi:cell division protein FtsX
MTDQQQLVDVQTPEPSRSETVIRPAPPDDIVRSDREWEDTDRPAHDPHGTVSIALMGVLMLMLVLLILVIVQAA